jgi:hypothetical protein
LAFSARVFPRSAHVLVRHGFEQVVVLFGVVDELLVVVKLVRQGVVKVSCSASAWTCTTAPTTF